MFLEGMNEMVEVCVCACKTASFLRLEISLAEIPS